MHEPVRVQQLHGGTHVPQLLPRNRRLALHLVVVVVVVVALIVVIIVIVDVVAACLGVRIGVRVPAEHARIGRQGLHDYHQEVRHDFPRPVQLGREGPRRTVGRAAVLGEETVRCDAVFLHELDVDGQLAA